MDDPIASALKSAGIVLLAPLYRRFAVWLFETVTRPAIFALGWLLGGLRFLIAHAVPRSIRAFPATSRHRSRSRIS